MRHATCAPIVAIAAAAIATTAGAQTTVDVDTGQAMRQTDLTGGTFDGQTFGLAPQTTFEINSGGTIGPVGQASFPATPFDFEGAAVNINAGGRFLRPSLASNVMLNVRTGGRVDADFGAFAGTTVNVTGGIVGTGLTAFGGSNVTLATGSIGSGLRALGATVEVSGGSVGSNFSASSGSVVNIAGGTFGPNLIALPSSEINISGGSFGSLSVRSNAALNLTVTELSIDGVEMTPPAGSDSLLITERGGAALVATLADGASFDLTLNTSNISGQDLVAAAASVLVTFTAPPPCACEFGGDADGIDIRDLLVYLDAWLTRDASADLDGNGVTITDLIAYLTCWLPASNNGSCP